MLHHFSNKSQRSYLLTVILFLSLRGNTSSSQSTSHSFPHVPELPTVQRGRTGSKADVLTKNHANVPSPATTVGKAKDKGPDIVKFGHTYMYVKNGVLIMSEIPPIKKSPALTHEKKMENMPLADR